MTNQVTLETSRSRLHPHVKELIVLAYVVLVLFLPNFVLNVSRLYHVDASAYVAVNLWKRQAPWLSYSFSAVEIVAVLYALFKKVRKDQIRIRLFLSFVLIKDIFRFLCGLTSMFTYCDYGDYSILLCTLVGYGCYLLVDNETSRVDLEDVMDLIVFLNFFTQFLFVLTGRQMANGGRYAALGSDVGSLGNMCFLYYIYFIFARKSSRHMYVTLPCCFLSMLLSGSRSNILYAIIFSLVFFFKIREGASLNPKKKRFLQVAAILIVLIPAIFINLSFFSTSLFQDVFLRIQRAVAGFFGDRSYILLDSSFAGRVASVQAGLQTLLHNPLGISGSSIDLQLTTIENGYFTFPHSTLLSYYLLWGVGALCCYVGLIVLIVKAVKQKNTVWVVLTCLAVTFILYGGPIVSSKMYFWYFVLVGACKRSICEKEAEQKRREAEKRAALTASDAPATAVAPEPVEAVEAAEGGAS